MKVVITAGGTGGHIYPALSIINKIKEEEKNSEILYIGTTDRMEKDMIPNLGIDYIGIKIKGLNKNPIKLIKTLNYNIKAYIKCKKVLKDFKPDIVIGVGGYVTVPVLKAAQKLNIKTAIHEQNSIPGKANIFLSKKADIIFTSMEDSNKYFKNNNIVLSGNPRGEELSKIKKATKKEYDLSNKKKLILITMGSLGASSINNKILEGINKFKNKDYEVIFVTGKKNFEEVSRKKIPSNVKVYPYIENMGELLKITDLIISRAGATIISEITALGIPSIIVPSPYVVNNHQVMNAKYLKKCNASEIIYEEYFNIDTLLSEIDNIITNEKRYKTLKDSSKKIGITDGSSRIYKEIKKIID